VNFNFNSIKKTFKEIDGFCTLESVVFAFLRTEIANCDDKSRNFSFLATKSVSQLNFFRFNSI